MKSPLTVTAVLLVLAGGAASTQRLAWTFEDAAVGRAPQGFVFADAGASQPGGAWQVLRDGANAVLGNAAHGRGVTLAIASGTSLGSLTLSTRLRFSEGPGVAGIAWRYRDPENYYSVALDLRGQNVRMYRVVMGNRTRLEDEDDLELDPTAWHTIKVEDTGGRMRVWIDGVPVADGRDRARSEPGGVGVWTSGEATVWFDDLQAEPVAESFRNRRS
jgi:hypothetical protein